MPPITSCPGCKQKIQNKECLTCTLCKHTYDLECANVLKERFYSSMTIEQKKAWKCQTCRSKMPKTDNTNTPIRLHDRESAQLISTPTEISNITIRKCSTNTKNYSMISDNSILGDTLYTEGRTTAQNTETQTENILQTLNEIIIQRLQENNKLIILELKDTIKAEINKAISQLRKETEQKTNALTKQNGQIKDDIKRLSSEINNLKAENEELRTKISGLSTTNTSTDHLQPPPIIPCIDTNDKKIVLYGLIEYYNEPEYELHARIVDLFHDTMQLNITGYIEDMYRLGRNSNKNRPLVIELLSKRITKYIKSNSHCFQGTTIYISDYLDINAQKERQQLKEKMIAARKQGLHAVIRRNQLYIQGKPYNLTQEEEEKQSDYYKTPEENHILHKNNQEVRYNQSREKEQSESKRNHSFRKPKTTL